MRKLKPNFKPFLSAGLILFVFLFSGCTKTRPGGADTLVVAIPQAPILLDPRLATDAEGQKIGALLYDGLIALNENQEVMGHLAEHWEETSPLTYRFYLRRGILFSNGKELTSQDVACTFGFIQNAENASPFRGEFEKLQLSVEGPYVFTLTLREPYAPFFILLRKGIVSCDQKSGSGPYILAENQPQRRLTLAANPNYFLGSPKMPRLVFEVIKDDTTRVLKLMNREVDLVQNAIPSLLIPKILQTKGLSQKTLPGTTFAYLGLNLKDKVLDNQFVRRALAYGLDRDAIIRYLWKGNAVKAYSLLAPTNWAYHSGKRTYEHNVKLAKYLLDEAGFPDPDGDGPLPRFSLTLKTSTVKERIDIANLVAHQLSEIGVQVTVKPYEWGIFSRDLAAGNFQLYTLTWVGVVEPNHFYNILNSTQFPPAGANRDFFVNARVDSLTDKARATFNIETRKTLYEEVQSIVAEELPFIPLWYENNVVLYWDDLKEVTLTPEPSYRNFVRIFR